MNISLEKVAPPVAFVIIGFIMVMVGSTGVIPIGNPQPSITDPWVKDIVIVIGILLIFLGPLLVWREVYAHNPKPNTTNKRGTSEVLSTRSSLSSDSSTLWPSIPELDGKWLVFYGYSIDRNISQVVGIAEIRQKDNRFYMKISLNKSKTGRMVDHIFEYEGTISNRQIIANYHAVHPPGSFMVGTTVLHPIPTGDILFGGSLYVNRQGKIILDRCLLRRN